MSPRQGPRAASRTVSTALCAFSHEALLAREVSHKASWPERSAVPRAEDRRSVQGPSLLTVAFTQSIFLTTVALLVEWESLGAVFSQGEFGPKDHLFLTLRAEDQRSVQGPSLLPVAFPHRCLSNGRLLLFCDTRESFNSCKFEGSLKFESSKDTRALKFGRTHNLTRFGRAFRVAEIGSPSEWLRGALASTQRCAPWGRTASGRWS